jgi:hypothetical protein
MTICLHHTEDGLWLCGSCLDSRSEDIDTDDVKSATDLAVAGLSLTCNHCGRNIVAERTVDDILADSNELLSRLLRGLSTRKLEQLRTTIRRSGTRGSATGP